MNKKEYKELTGENPEDMFGGDWKNVLEDFAGGTDGETPSISQGNNGRDVVEQRSKAAGKPQLQRE